MQALQFKPITYNTLVITRKYSPLLDKIDVMCVSGKLLKYWSFEKQEFVEIGTSVISKNLQFCKDLEIANGQLLRIVVGDIDWNVLNDVGNIHNYLLTICRCFIYLVYCVVWSGLGHIFKVLQKHLGSNFDQFYGCMGFGWVVRWNVWSDLGNGGASKSTENGGGGSTKDQQIPIISWCSNIMKFVL